jgi:hypothetical protein
MHHDLELIPVLDAEGNYTARFELVHERIPEGVSIFLVVEPPGER